MLSLLLSYIACSLCKSYRKSRNRVKFIQNSINQHDKNRVEMVEESGGSEETND